MTTPWIKASASNEEGTWVEQRHADGWVEVRDTKDRSGPVLHFHPDEFAAWLAAAKRGALDGLLDDNTVG
jgi:hypothetical protein